ncbi:hypothetical protein HPB52_013014 [Rhipicephalus sanguineus]|uniref:Uncharacterized protein n=1 Tax=Rhipicephalus sanguineus TaxID=34632 RepID=A0A9D4SSB1_RHISA|nr:hypothetical protein HPB52_013014 [Rhipicephalus sanguineus]
MTRTHKALEIEAHRAALQAEAHREDREVEKRRDVLDAEAPREAQDAEHPAFMEHDEVEAGRLALCRTLDAADIPFLFKHPAFY